MKILYVSAAGQRGGLEVVLLNTLRCLDRTRFTPLVALLEDGPLAQEVEDAAATVAVVKAGRVRNLVRGASAVADLRWLIGAERIGVVHTYNAKAHLYGGLAAALAGVPCLHHLQGVPRPSLSRDGFVSLLSIMIPARVTVACSRYVAEAFARTWHSKRKMVVVHNGVLSQAAAMPDVVARVRGELEVPINAPLVLMVSRLQRWKGVHVFLDAAGSVARERPEAHFIVVGGTLFGLERNYAASLCDQVVQLGLERRVRFVGHRSDVAPFFAAADVVVHASIEPEPFGMVLLEAMGAGKPVIASGLGGPREIIDNGVTGLLVAAGRPEQLARAILSLISDPGRCAEMGEAGARRVGRFFSAQRMVERLQSLYDEMAERPVRVTTETA